MIHICTITDKGYLIKSVAQYQSIKRTTKNFTWWVLCMDEQSKEILAKLNFPECRLVSLKTVETKALAATRHDRSQAEYCWTMKPSWIKFLLTHKKMGEILYTDSDIYFFNNARLVFDEVKRYSIGITSHNFPKEMAGWEERTGRFNAGVVYFRNDKEGNSCLSRWAGQCIEWCYWRLEDGKLCDQMYLDEWPKKYKRCHIFKQKGVNIAPWNVKGFEIRSKKGELYANRDKVVFYHFHQFQINSESQFTRSTGYTIPQKAGELIYEPYEKDVVAALGTVRKVEKNFSSGIMKRQMKKHLTEEIRKRAGATYLQLRSFVFSQLRRQG